MLTNGSGVLKLGSGRLPFRKGCLAGVTLSTGYSADVAGSRHTRSMDYMIGYYYYSKKVLVITIYDYRTESIVITGL